jgi:predicted transglutaminase-like cysteine proteinase
MSHIFRRTFLKQLLAVVAAALFLCAGFLHPDLVYAEGSLGEPFADTAQLFGRKEIVHQGTEAFTKWTSALAAERRAKPTERSAEWKRFLESLRGMNRNDQLDAVNSYMNSVPYVSDQENYGQADYWATVEEFLERGGDCEDYALAKYHSLIRLGFRDQDLRLVILFDQNKQMNHAVLAVALGGRWKILDNQYATVRDDDEISYYKPIYAVSKNSWWRFI